MVPMTVTVPEVYVSIIPTVLSESYDDLEKNMNHLNKIKLKNYPGEIVSDFFDAILVDAGHLDGDGQFKPGKLGYITRIFKMLLMLSFVSGEYINTRILLCLLRKFYRVTRMS